MTKKKKVQQPMTVKVKKLTPEATMPHRAHETDAGYDLTAVSKKFNAESGTWIYGTGIALEIPEGYVGLIYPRSSIYKRYMYQTNAVGVIDAGYRGEVKVIMRCAHSFVRPSRLWERMKLLFCKHFKKGKPAYEYPTDAWALNFNDYKVGERIAQLIIMPIPAVQFKQSEWLAYGERGSDGHGSTGN